MDRAQCSPAPVLPGSSFGLDILRTSSHGRAAPFVSCSVEDSLILMGLHNPGQSVEIGFSRAPQPDRMNCSSFSCTDPGECRFCDTTVMFETKRQDVGIREAAARTQGAVPTRLAGASDQAPLLPASWCTAANAGLVWILHESPQRKFPMKRARRAGHGIDAAGLPRRRCGHATL